MSDDPLKEYHPRQWPTTVDPISEDCPPWTRHAAYLKEQEDIWAHAAVLSECECHDCHLESLCPYKFKSDEESQKGCIERIYEDLMKPFADGMNCHDKMIVTMLDAKSQLKRILAINKWLIEKARKKFYGTPEAKSLQCACYALAIAIQEIGFIAKRMQSDECRFDGTNFTDLE